MPQNSKLMIDRFAEISAVAALEQLHRRLEDLAREPSTKRYQRDRENAAEAWAEVRELGAQRAAAAAKPIAPPKRNAKPRIETTENDTTSVV